MFANERNSDYSSMSEFVKKRNHCIIDCMCYNELHNDFIYMPLHFLFKETVITVITTLRLL